MSGYNIFMLFLFGKIILLMLFFVKVDVKHKVLSSRIAIIPLLFLFAIFVKIKTKKDHKDDDGH